ncbi:MAG TPA: helix-turn-helix domain-containing protein [Trebonia sp.]|jgi:AcrR family transcriptional regulator|nr:helix-turn-helix domain-containing protein [Trebonia sp.]
MATEATGLRELKRIRTRQAIADAAVELFAAHGYDNVTVAQVAGKAEVSVATLFNHVPDGKDALVFDDGTERRDALVASVRDRDPGVTLLDAIHGYLSTRGPFARQMPPEMELKRALILATPQLREYQRTLWMRGEEALVRVVAAETGRQALDPVVRALARYVLEVPDLVGMDPDPRASLDAVFTLLAHGWSEGE